MPQNATGRPHMLCTKRVRPWCSCRYCGAMAIEHKMKETVNNVNTIPVPTGYRKLDIGFPYWDSLIAAMPWPKGRQDHAMTPSGCPTANLGESLTTPSKRSWFFSAAFRWCQREQGVLSAERGKNDALSSPFQNKLHNGLVTCTVDLCGNRGSSMRPSRHRR